MRIDRGDVIRVLALLLLAFGLRFFSPLFPQVYGQVSNQSPTFNCVQHTPIDAKGTPGTLCGLAYPFQRGYPDGNTGVLRPPNGQVFDEVYFPVFAHDDLTGVSYFDPEPPLGKLLIGYGELADGWWRATFEHRTGSYADLGFNPFGWRLAACIFGTVCVPLMYLLALSLWRNRMFATAAGVLSLVDGMFFIQSRIGMIDIFAIFFILLSYWLFNLHLQARGQRDSLVTLSLTGLAISLAIAAKWIALAALATILFVLVVRAVRRRFTMSVGAGPSAWRWGRDEAEGPAIPGGAAWSLYLPLLLLVMGALPVLVYIASWYPFFQRGQFHGLADLWQYQVSSFEYHHNLKATHPYGSPWYSWPFLYRPVAYYFESTGLGTDTAGQNLVAGMADLGNPFIWWTSLPCLLIVMPYLAIRRRSYPAALILIGFITQYLPWSLISRVIFLYHMFGGLPFMVLALALTLAKLAEATPHIHFGTAAGPALDASTHTSARRSHEAGTGTGGSRSKLRYIAYAHLVVAVLFFLYFYPVWTGLPIGSNDYLGGFGAGRMWFRSWI